MIREGKKYIVLGGMLLSLLWVTSCFQEDIIFLNASHCHLRGKLKESCVIKEIKILFKKKQKVAYELHLTGPRNIKEIKSELLGLNMEMPKEFIKWKRKAHHWEALLKPALCTEKKMKWRLKIILEMSEGVRYYTFIDFNMESM